MPSERQSSSNENSGTIRLVPVRDEIDERRDELNAADAQEIERLEARWNALIEELDGLGESASYSNKMRCEAIEAELEELDTSIDKLQLNIMTDWIARMQKVVGKGPARCWRVRYRVLWDSNREGTYVWWSDETEQQALEQAREYCGERCEIISLTLEIDGNHSGVFDKIIYGEQTD